MSFNKETKNIVYKKYTSSDMSSFYKDNSNRNDNLISIMRDRIIIWKDAIMCNDKNEGPPACNK